MPDIASDVMQCTREILVGPFLSHEEAPREIYKFLKFSAGDEFMATKRGQAALPNLHWGRVEAVSWDLESSLNQAGASRPSPLALGEG